VHCGHTRRGRFFAGRSERRFASDWAKSCHQLPDQLVKRGTGVVGAISDQNTEVEDRWPLDDLSPQDVVARIWPVLHNNAVWALVEERLHGVLEIVQVSLSPGQLGVDPVQVG
jgi:hypothetical protein